MKSWYKNNVAVALGLLVILVVLGLVFFNKGDEGKEVESGNRATEVEGEKIEVLGVIECLPYRLAASDQSCVKGIKGDDGKIYSLNTVAVNGAEISMKEGTKVRALGVYQPADTTSNESSTFRYDGVLVVTSLKVR